MLPRRLVGPMPHLPMGSRGVSVTMASFGTPFKGCAPKVSEALFSFFPFFFSLFYFFFFWVVSLFVGTIDQIWSLGLTFDACRDYLPESGWL